MNRTGNIIKAAVFFLLAAIGGTVYIELSKTKKTAGLARMPAPEFAVQAASGPAVAETTVQPSSAPAAGAAQAADTETQPADLIETLLSVRFNEEPGNAFKDGDWKTDLSENYNHNQDAGSFYKSGSADEIRLYSYTTPSLEEYKELIMAGYVRICKNPNQDATSDLLETNGFKVSVPEEKVSGFRAANWQGVLKVEKDDVSGFTYYEPYKGKRCLKVIMSHKDVSKYDHPPQISKSFFFNPKLPDRLIEELETYGIANSTGNDWAGIKNMSESSEAVPPEKLISAYNSVKINELEAGKKPAFMLFRDYLVSYLFDSVNAETQELFRKTLQDTPPRPLSSWRKPGSSTTMTLWAGLTTPRRLSVSGCMRNIRSHTGDSIFS